MWVSPLLRWFKAGIDQAIHTDVEYKVELHKRMNVSQKQKQNVPEVSKNKKIPEVSSSVVKELYNIINKNVFSIIYHSLSLYFTKEKIYILFQTNYDKVKVTSTPKDSLN